MPESTIYTQLLDKGLDLETIQNLELQMMVFVDEICRENGIRYYLAHGSALGAVRHGGFIPWDDDMDIMMPRPDYERFVKVMSANKGRYKVLSVETSEDWRAPLAKIIDTNTVLVQQVHRDKRPLGLYIDCFVLDGIPSRTLGVRTWLFSQDFLLKMWNASAYDLDPSVSTIGGKAKNAVSEAIFRVFGTRRLSEWLCKGAARFSYDDCDEVCVLAWHGYRRPRETFKKQMLGDGRDVEFMGHSFTIPADAENYLAQLYGNYLEFPPEEGRKPHHTYVVHMSED